MSRRGWSLPANASGFGPHCASITSRFGQVYESARPGPGHDDESSYFDPDLRQLDTRMMNFTLR
jgi:hypothetical protein